MKDLFPGYYSPSDEEFSELWQKCTFIFDTNVLLDFYEYNDETREDFFEVLEAIKDRLWIPHQVALEYQRNRINRIKKAESNFNSAEENLNEIIQNIIKAFKYVPSELVEDMIKDVEKVFNSFHENLIPLKENAVKVDGADYIREKITDLFTGKIGELPASQDELDLIYLEGERRYKNCQPPGFKDKGKDKSQNKDNTKDKDNPYTHKGLLFKREYGDLILWKQILKQVESNSLSHIIFITGDNKEDWWRIEHGKTIGGPHPELTQEIVDAGASMFYMYRPERFLEFAKKYLQQEIKEKSIQQVEEVSVSNSLSEPELHDTFSRQLSAIDGYGLKDIERLVAAANNPVSNIERLVAAANNPVSSIADFAKQLSVTEAMRLTNIDKYGFINNIAIASMRAEQDRFTASVNQTIESHNRFIEQMKKQVAIPKQLIPNANQEIDIESSREVESSED
ncbi:PIN domain-containing protein [Microcoleus sp. D3_18_C4]|uniref:PIN domain-containing protein n=1 Tax=Microcoleus sp. D3_18_C4 TaxID=3055335 RepID=UPI002FCF2CE3